MVDDSHWYLLMNFKFLSPPKYFFWACLIVPIVCQISPLENSKSFQTQHVQYQTNRLFLQTCPFISVALVLIQLKSWSHCWWTSPLGSFPLAYSHSARFSDFTWCICWICPLLFFSFCHCLRPALLHRCLSFPWLQFCPPSSSFSTKQPSL